ncbi:hypothetical protein FRC17_001589 [Serendipita sp. 399]|nr:hypothetical protein FRC17_001589 [Serendipita sp. 399]
MTSTTSGLQTSWGKQESSNAANISANKPTTSSKDETMSASLLHRLAGPSTGKAGLARDQTEITKVIAEASEGSKFYQNEKRKDEELSKKIESILKQRDEFIAAGADIPRLEALADRALVELEATRDLTQYIVHIDMDSFYASVETLDDPSLIGKAFAVGGGVLTTASYAARVFGVRSGMPEYIAKKLCPHLLVVKNRFWRYSELSGQVMGILRRFDPTMDPAGTDEAYLNITAYCQENNISANECVQKIRGTILEETKLTASAGIAPNKACLPNKQGTHMAKILQMLAKICSEKNKPNGQFCLQFDPQVIRDFMNTLPIRRIPGIGRVSERLLDSIGIKTCGDIHTHRATLALLDKHFHMYEKLEIYLGLGSNVVKPWPREARKSVGAERTFQTISDPAMIHAKLEHVAQELEEDLERLGYAGHTVTLKIKLDTFEGMHLASSSGGKTLNGQRDPVRSRAKSAQKPVRKYDELVSIGEELLAHELPLKLRLLGLRVTGLKDLRAPEHGIKRFFGQTGDAPSRPTKRRKFGDEAGMNDSSDARDPIWIEDDDASDTGEQNKGKRAASATPERPRTHPLLDVERAPRASSHEPMPSQELASPTRPNVSTKQNKSKNVPSSSSLEKAQPRKSETVAKPLQTKPSPSSREATLGFKVQQEQHVCPICSKTLQTDNAGFNAHIDWCLSRSAILEASATGDSDKQGGKKMVTGENSGVSGKKGGSKEVPRVRGRDKSGDGKRDIWSAWKQTS